jgi:hypothetical protein
MDILGKALRLETTIAGRLEKATKGFVRSGAREPLEIVHAVLDAVEAQVQPGGRGTRVFPFNRIELSVLSPSRDVRARLEAMFDGDPPLAARVTERLRSAGCTASPIELIINYAARPHKNWRAPEFHLEFARVEIPAAAVPVPDAQPDRIDVTVVHGVAEKRMYSFGSRRIDLGRCAEVRDSRNRLIRTNHVAFTEGAGDVNQTVSRQHAHVAYEPASGHFRLHDDGGAHGTSIVREGRSIAVPRGSRGVRLCSGDEIVLGEARLRIKLA